jgi:hypothetical protein
MPVPSTNTASRLCELTLLHDPAGDLHQIGNVELHARDRARIKAAAEPMTFWSSRWRGDPDPKPAHPV